MNKETIEDKPNLIGILTQPTQEFLKIKQRPVIWVPLIIVSLIMMIGGIVTALNIDYTNDPEIQEAILLFDMDESLMIQFSAILAGVGNFILPGITALISTIIYLVIAMIIKKPVSFSQLFSMNTHIMLISALSVLLNGLLSIVLTGDSTVLFTSLAAIIQTDNIVLEKALSMLEIFTIWGLVLTIIGLQKVANFSKQVAVIIVVGFYLISLSFSVFTGWITTLSI